MRTYLCGEMRTYLLSTVAAAALLAATSARAQDATWLLNPGSGSFNTATNWNPAVVPTNTAIFDASNTTFILFQPFTTTSVATLQFNSGAPAYSFATSEGLFTSISITGAGGNTAHRGREIVAADNELVWAQRESSRALDRACRHPASRQGGHVECTSGEDDEACIPAGGAVDESGEPTGVGDYGGVAGGARTAKKMFAWLPTIKVGALEELLTMPAPVTLIDVERFGAVAKV